MQARVRGLEELQRVGQLLEEQDKKVRRDIGKHLTKAVKPVGDEAKSHAREILPRRGGLNEWVASSRTSVRTKLTGSGANVRLVATRKTSSGKTAKLQDIDSGTVRHRVFGRNQWVMQRVRPRWFTDPAEQAAPEIQTSLLKVLDDIEARLRGRP